MKEDAGRGHVNLNMLEFYSFAKLLWHAYMFWFEVTTVPLERTRLLKEADQDTAEQIQRYLTNKVFKPNFSSFGAVRKVPE